MRQSAPRESVAARCETRLPLVTLNGTLVQLLCSLNAAEWHYPRRNDGARRVIQTCGTSKGDIMNIHHGAGQGENFPIAEQETVREREEEARKIRRLQVMISMVMSVIGQDPNLTVEEASELAAGAKRAALAMFPDKELAYDLLYKPRLQRLMKERFRLQ
jgi:hypothetical protein